MLIDSFTLSVEEVLRNLETNSSKGLNSEQVSDKKAIHGFNGKNNIVNF